MFEGVVVVLLVGLFLIGLSCAATLRYVAEAVYDLGSIILAAAEPTTTEESGTPKSS